MSLKVYKSSAGSGKTYTLVKEYLILALATENPNRYKSIMAVTFTNKASNEMKERVIKYLKIISGPTSDHSPIQQLIEDLKDILGISLEALQNRAFQTLKSILHSYSDFNISTIDKFILKIIRSFALDFKIPLNFDVELDNDSLLQKSIDHLLAEIGENKVLTDFLINYVNLQTDDDKGHDISRSLMKISQKLLTDDSLPYLKKIKDLSFQEFLQFKKEADETIIKYQSALEGILEKGKKLIAENGLVANDFKGKTKGSIYNFFNSIGDPIFEAAKPTLIKYVEDEVWSHPETAESQKMIVAQIRANLFSYYTEIETIKNNQLKNILSLKAVVNNLFEIALLNEIDKQLQVLKKENNFIHISEFNQKVAEIVVQQPIPFIYERIGERYQNYLVDEFQDTSELQWQNLMPLIENALAYQNLNLLVGDVKQAIYRFRGGHVDQFQHLGNEQHWPSNPILVERLQNIRRHLQEKTLQKNYRSLPEIVKFNNQFFKDLLPALKFPFAETYYEDYYQEVATKKTGGYVQIQSFPKENKEEDLSIHFNYIFSKIQLLLSNGRNYKEIAILCRTKNQISRIGEELTKKNIPILSSEGLSLGKNKEVSFIMNLIQLEYLPNEDKDIVGICNYLFSGNDEAIQEVCQAKDRRKQLQKTSSERLNQHLPNIKHLNLYEATEKIVSALNLERDNPFIQKLMEVLNDRQKENIQEFLSWWDEKKEKIFISSPESINAIHLMTIHKAKGLEFPVVFLPFANNIGKNSAEQQWVDISHLNQTLSVGLVNLNSTLEKSDLAEVYLENKRMKLLDNLNTLYVALTRPVEELYISLEKGKTDNKTIETRAHFFDVLLNNSNSDCIEFGTPLKVNRKKETNLKQPLLPQISGDWKQKVNLSYNAPLIWNVPQDSEESFQSIEDPQTRGNLLHTLLAQIQHSSEIDDVIDKNILKGILHKNDAPAIKSIINNLFATPEFLTLWNGGQHLVEKELITPNGQLLRPDRIIQKQEEIILLDFKTGENRKTHFIQIKMYEESLSNIFSLPINSYLIYLEPTQIVPC